MQSPSLHAIALVVAQAAAKEDVPTLAREVVLEDVQTLAAPRVRVAAEVGVLGVVRVRQREAGAVSAQPLVEQLALVRVGVVRGHAPVRARVVAAPLQLLAVVEYARTVVQRHRPSSLSLIMSLLTSGTNTYGR